MKLSIIVPIYNSQLYLRQCLHHLLSLEDEAIEFILIDDGSTDQSKNICSQFLKLDNRFKYFYKSNGGVSSARNMGLQMAKGEYVVFLDSDDYFSSKLLDALRKMIDQNIVVLILRRYYIERDTYEYNYDFSSNDFKIVSTNLYRISKYISFMEQKKIFASGSGEVLFKREIASGLTFNENISILEDYDFFFKLFAKVQTHIYIYDGITTYINDNVVNSLTKKYITSDSSKINSLGGNVLLQKAPELKYKVFWIECYFYCKKMNFMNRYDYFFKNKALISNNIHINKFFFASFFLILFNIDINKVRVFLLKILMKK